MIDTMQIPTEARLKYLERRKQDVIACYEALSKQDYYFLERLGHQIKGNAITFGFDELTTVAIDIEQAAKAKNHSQLADLVSKFEELVSNARV